MKKLVFKILCFVFITSFAYANDEQIYEQTKLNFNSYKPVACSTPDKIIDIVDKTFIEKPYMEGKGIAAAADGKTFISTQVYIGINLETQTFSIVELINPNLACIIGAGTGFKLIGSKGKKTNVYLQMQTN
tara:strand:- start:1244 stop:1636 length:393 start_codon:yes stop_codon:yes gene_type:complete